MPPPKLHITGGKQEGNDEHSLHHLRICVKRQKNFRTGQEHVSFPSFVKLRKDSLQRCRGFLCTSAWLKGFSTRSATTLTDALVGDEIKHLGMANARIERGSRPTFALEEIALLDSIQQFSIRVGKRTPSVFKKKKDPTSESWNDVSFQQHLYNYQASGPPAQESQPGPSIYRHGHKTQRVEASLYIV